MLPSAAIQEVYYLQHARVFYGYSTEFLLVSYARTLKFEVCLPSLLAVLMSVSFF